MVHTYIKLCTTKSLQMKSKDKGQVERKYVKHTWDKRTVFTMYKSSCKTKRGINLISKVDKRLGMLFPQMKHK